MNEQDAARQFGEAAERFCSLVDRADALEPQRFAKECASCLAILYHLGVRLPDVTPFGEQVADGTMSSEKARAIRQLVERKLSRHNLYWQVFDPYAE